MALVHQSLGVFKYTISFAFCMLLRVCSKGKMFGVANGTENMD